MFSKNPLLAARELTYVVTNNENVDHCDDNYDGVLDSICPKVSNVRDALKVLQEHMSYSVNSGEIYRNSRKLTLLLGLHKHGIKSV